MISLNLFGVRYFGETEFYLCLIKSELFLVDVTVVDTDHWIRLVTLMIGLIITGLVITLGGGPDGQRIGFRYWKNPGAVVRAGLVDNIGSDRFIAILSVIVQAAFSFQAMEIVAMYAHWVVPREKHATDRTLQRRL